MLLGQVARGEEGREGGLMRSRSPVYSLCKCTLYTVEKDDVTLLYREAFKVEF